MGVLRHHHRLSLSAATAFALLLCLASAAVSIFVPTGQIDSGLVGAKEETRSSGLEAVERVLSRRRLGGPGSSPPTCRSKCGKCTPCKAVHVPIQPGRSIPMEYYPEAWRCKCGNKLFMP